MKLKYIGIKTLSECGACKKIGWDSIKLPNYSQEVTGEEHDRYNRIIEESIDGCYDYICWGGKGNKSKNGWCTAHDHVPRDKL